MERLKLSEILKNVPPGTPRLESRFEPGSREFCESEAATANSVEGGLKGYDCQECHNKGLIYSPQENDFDGNYYMVSRECSCMRIRRELRQRALSGFAQAAKKFTFSTFKTEHEWQKVILTAAKDYATSPEGWFYIGGQPGSGKTHICTAIADHFFKHDRSVFYMMWNEAVGELKSCATDAEKYDAILNQIKKADVLYIDDFFKSKNITAADINISFKIINYRYNEEKTTIVSSEHSINGIIDIDEALGSRIAEMVNGKEIFITYDKNKNYRLRPKKL